jgi:RHH-type rel operon transcriptional repressor/antitoxin RelB
VKRSAENKLRVVAVRIDPQIEQQLLAKTTGRRQSFFLQEIIERGIEAMEEAWLPAETVAQIRSGEVPQVRHARPSTPDLFSDEENPQT